MQSTSEQIVNLRSSKTKATITQRSLSLFCSHGAKPHHSLNIPHEKKKKPGKRLPDKNGREKPGFGKKTSEL
jgi:hypothetical protein